MSSRRPLVVKISVGAAFCVFGFVVAFSSVGQGQARSVADGVYSEAQAARGHQLYQAQCASCHGNQMEGVIGPPLAGDAFLADWSGRALSDLVDRIQKTMPFNLPGSLSTAESIDLGAYILQTGKFRAGQADLSQAVLTGITMPTAQAPPAPPPTAVAGPLLPPEGNLAELMRAIAFPNSNIIFNLQVKDPDKEKKKPVAAQPFDYVEWGSTVYPGWLAVDQAAVALVESAPLLLTPGRKCQNGRPVPVDRADYRQYVAALVDVGREARRASQARNYEAFQDIAEKLNDACANCHKKYRDTGGAEGSGGIGGTRCQ